jgi:hypothetical protein
VTGTTPHQLLESFTPGSASGNIALTTVNATNSSVLLAANHGAITAQDIDAKHLAVFGSGGVAQLFGHVNGISGPSAASQVDKSGQRDNLYRFNDCAIGTVSCIVLPLIPPQKPQPVNNVSILQQQQQFTDPTVDLLNIGTEDLF